MISDKDLRWHVLVRLSKFGPRISRAVQVSVQRGHVTLTGEVGSDYERRLIEQQIEKVAGVAELSNLISIRSAEPPVNTAPRLELELPRPSRRILIIAAAVAAVIGIAVVAAPWNSGPRIVPVKGTVLFAGRPAEGALLTLHPLTPIGAQPLKPQGRVDESGHVEWTTRRRGDGVPVGEYAVTIEWSGFSGSTNPLRPGARLPAEYSRAECSPLRVRVDSDSDCRIALDLP